MVKVLANKLVFGLVSMIKGTRIHIGASVIDLKTLPTSDYIKALIFYGLYEKAERQLIQKYLPENVPVVELGSSLGIVTCQIASQTSQKLIAIEANPYLVDVIKTNCLTNGFNHVEVINGAICTEGQMYFHNGENTTTGIVSNKKSQNPVKCINLSGSIIGIVDRPYFLVSDIEGAEIAFLEQNNSFLKECTGMIMEVHKTTNKGTTYTARKLKDLVVKRGFEIKKEIGNVIYAVKSNAPPRHNIHK